MATSWEEPACSVCRLDFHRIRSGPKRGLGIYTECWNCEARRQAAEAATRSERRKRLVVSESEEHWRRLRQTERGDSLAEDMGEEAPYPNPRRARRARR